MKVCTKTTRLLVCSMCGIELEGLDFQQEWRWYSTSDNKTSNDPSWCHSQLSTYKGIRKVFDKYKVDIPPMMMDMVEAKYKKIKGDKIFHGKCCESIVASCLFHTYKEFGEYCTSNYIQELLTKTE